MTFFEVYGVAALIILAYMIAIWLASLLLCNSSIVDIFWGAGFVMVNWFYFALTPGGFPGRSASQYLGHDMGPAALYILYRNWNKGEDFRYRKWREEAGAKWRWQSFFKVFVLQGFLMWIISAPLLAAHISRAYTRLTALDFVAILVWAVGFFFEATGDWQIARFKADPADVNPAIYHEREGTGSILVRGVEPGDVLTIHIAGIRPEGHTSGSWWDKSNKANSFLKIEHERVHFPGGLWTPLCMMIGDIYVTPVDPCLKPDDNGCKWISKDVAPGNSLSLKAQLAGGSLFLSDVHAVQKDGEILGLGAERAAEMALHITKNDTFFPERPTILKRSFFLQHPLPARLCRSARSGDK